jgi:hypothetical protein
MSRYVCHFSVNLTSQNVRTPLDRVLEACQLEPIYELKDYVMAREIPGRVPFSKLVTVEVLIDVTNGTADSVTLSFVVKNEELPLNSNNHCRQIFDLLRLALQEHYRWEPIDSRQPIVATPTRELELSRSTSD